jgi:hypothetical protein
MAVRTGYQCPQRLSLFLQAISVRIGYFSISELVWHRVIETATPQAIGSFGWLRGDL